MAGRSGAGVGVIVTISILSILTLALFVTTIVFYGNLGKAEAELLAAQQGMNDFIRPQERQDPIIAGLADQARRSNASVVGYLHGSLQQVMERVTGTNRGQYEEMMTRLGQARLDGVAQASGWNGTGEAQTIGELVADSNLLQVLRTSNDHIQSLGAQLADAERAKTVAEADLRNEIDRVGALQSQHEATLGALQDQMDRYRDEVDGYRSGTDRAKEDMQRRVDQVLAEAAQREDELLDRITSLEEERQRLQNQLDVLRGERKKDLFQGADEYALVDGSVIGVDPVAGTATISLGKADKIRVGMTFVVYTDASAIRPDAQTGEYPVGKASLEVLSISDDSAVCRVLSERQGNPVIRGDVIANAVYDPKKVYKLLLFGNFDANRDGTATEAEQAGVRAMVEGWGGRVTEELTGDVDFLVLGERPVLPPEPTVDSPIAVVQQYNRMSDIVRRYDDLFAQAQATSIPVLNENRLRTLIGAD